MYKRQPIVKAWQEGLEHAPVWENAQTIAAGIRVPVAVGDFLIIRAIKESDGFGIIVDDNEIIQRMSGRRVHPGSGRTYHITHNPPKK